MNDKTPAFMSWCQRCPGRLRCLADPKLTYCVSCSRTHQGTGFRCAFIEARLPNLLRTAAVNALGRIAPLGIKRVLMSLDVAQFILCPPCHDLWNAECTRQWEKDYY